RDQQLEYDVALALTSLGRQRTPRVGLLSPLLTPRNVSEPREGLAVLEEIKRSYDVAVVPHFADALPDGLDAVVVIGAAILKRDMLYALDQHVMAGKGLIVLVDPYARFNSASDVVVPQPSDEVNDVSDLLLRYGVRFELDAVVGDAGLASSVTGADARQISYPFWLRIGREQLSPAHSVSANLNELLFAEPGALISDGVRGRAGSMTALVTTGAASGALARTRAAGQSAEALAAMFVPDGKPRVLAAALDGPFDSAFPGPPAEPSGVAHLARSTGPAGVFAVADMDFIFDPMALQEVVTGDSRHARPLNDNIAFLLNMIECATGDPRLLAIRSRGTLQRPFTRVSQLLAAAQHRYRDQEARLLGAIGKVEGDVRKVTELAGVKDVSELPLAIRQKITTLLAALQPHRRELRQIRLGMREDIDRLGARLTMLNLAAGPLVAFAFAIAARWTRRRRLALLTKQ
ncbi:MAG: Gldg family protein, partial [Hyphomicrobium sp.]